MPDLRPDKEDTLANALFAAFDGSPGEPVSTVAAHEKRRIDTATEEVQRVAAFWGHTFSWRMAELLAVAAMEGVERADHEAQSEEEAGRG